MIRGCLPDVSPSSGAFRATFSQREKAFGGVRSHRSTGHCIKMCPLCGHTKSKL